MRLDDFKNDLLINGVDFSCNELMKNHTTFKIGGAVDIFIALSDLGQLKSVIALCTKNDVPFTVIGKGSNLLVSDNGIAGAVIRLPENGKIELIGDTVVCDAGVSLSSLCKFAAENTLSGLEFAYGIPGTVGGALYMNAGAYGSEMADVVQSAEHICRDGSASSMSVDKMQLSYRSSVYKTGGYIITKVVFSLKKAKKEDILTRMNELIMRRKDKQPLEYPSAGSTFKRPEGHFAGALIEQSGLKGVSVGGAKVSEKHCGFVINTGNATCNDVVMLIEKIKNTVYEKFGVELEQEIVVIGRN